MRSELDLIFFEAELLQELAGMAVAKDSICGKIVSGMHKEVRWSERLASTADSRFRIADDPMVEIYKICTHKRGQCKDDGRGIASGICYKSRMPYRRSVKLRRSVHCFSLQLGRESWIGVFKFVNGTMVFAVETPCSTEIDHAHPVVDGFRHPGAGLFVGRRKEDKIDGVALQLLPVKRH